MQPGAVLRGRGEGERGLSLRTILRDVSVRGVAIWCAVIPGAVGKMAVRMGLRVVVWRASVGARGHALRGALGAAQEGLESACVG